ncbi:tRNA dimethylallyltransferase [Dermatophagoides pteronyssinus]|uniref:tRNA dimethylallyltransferase n=1 Tax=Dermatophagoides pteronyssinus TaxID=6956 RepID=A0ABQ8JHU8_DERPT|nr:tRNA dimethylallyltransferase [Dermatophagoides pteronyssinus]
MRFFGNLKHLRQSFCSMISTKATTTNESNPLIVIIGATGCGKTKLSLELAKHYKNVEIISADSMQIYKGLDIATNKVLPNEMEQIPHHLIDMIDPFQQFTVLDFQKLALKSIDQIISKRKIPIIVGGTNYYIESILWDTLVYQQTGRQMSQILKEQRSQNGSRHGGPLRFKNSIILWVDCDKQILEKRLDERVDQMIRQGLLNELSEFHRNYNSKRFDDGKKADYTEGIFQAIGLKEFHNYLLMNEEERHSYDGQLKLGYGILMLKQRTRSYVNKQNKWIRRRFLISENIRKVPNVYRLDTTNLDEWNEKVLDHSIWIVDQYLQASISTPSKCEQIFHSLDQLAIRKMPNSNDDNNDENDSFISGQFYCDICQIRY